MKSYKRYLSLLCVFVLLFAVFSIPTNAEETEDTSEPEKAEIVYVLDMNVFDNNPRGHMDSERFILSHYGTEGTNLVANDHQATLVDPTVNANYEQGYEIYVYREDNFPMVKGGETFDFTLTGIKLWTFMYTTGTNEHYKAYDSFRIRVLYTDGSYKDLDSKYEKYHFNQNSKMQSFSIEGLEAEHDIQTIHIQLRWKPVTRIGLDYKERFIPRYSFYYLKDTVQVKIIPKSEGLLSGLIGWVTNIFNSITEGFSNIVEGFSNIGDWFSNLVSNITSGFTDIGTWFAELPSNLWNLISEGLKSLFVPDEEFMLQQSDIWNSLLSNRFGAIYQVGTVITDFGERIESSDKTNTIYIPKVSLASVGIPFEFGGYNVTIVPNGFEFMVESLKLIISIACTFMFVNGLRRRYDEVMGVNQ